MSERGPIYNVELIDQLPINDRGWTQQMPSRADLDQVKRISERTVAGYEVLLEHYRETMKKCDDAREAAQHLYDTVDLRGVKERWPWLKGGGGV